MMLTWKNGSTRRETCLTATFFNTNPHGLARDRTRVSAATYRRGVAGDLPSEAWHGTSISQQHCRLVDLREGGSVQDKRPRRPPSLVTIQALAHVHLYLTVTQIAVRTLSADETQPPRIANVHGSRETCARRINPTHRRKKD
jgi:hypothetical protein